MPQHTTSTLPRLAVLVLLIVGAVYANALLCGFVYDDWDLVVRNPWLREGRLAEAFRSGYWESSRGGSFYYRPVVSISYWVDHALWGTSPFGYHLRNVALHAASSVLVLLLAARWLSSRPAALAVAALFAVHPVHTQSVTWIAGRTDLLAALFCLLALLLFQAGADRLSRAPRGSTPVDGSPHSHARAGPATETLDEGSTTSMEAPTRRPAGAQDTSETLHDGGATSIEPASGTARDVLPERLVRDPFAPIRTRLAAHLLITAGLAAVALALLSKEMAVTFPALLLLHALLVSRAGDASLLGASASAAVGHERQGARTTSAAGTEAAGRAVVEREGEAPGGAEASRHAAAAPRPAGAGGWNAGGGHEPGAGAAAGWGLPDAYGGGSLIERLKPWTLPLAGSIVLVLGWLWLRTAVVGTAVGYADDPHAWWHPADGTRSRLLAVPLIIAFYLRRLIFPLRLGFESGIQPVRDAADLALWSTAAGTALLGFLAWRLRGRRPAASFGILWLLISLLPVLNILPVFESAMEHFAYLPSVGFTVAAVAIGRGLVRRPDPRVALCVGLAVVLGVRTMARNGDWKDEETFWRITVRDTPSARAWNNLGLHLRDAGDLEGASEALEKVREIRPDLASSWSNLGAVEAARGRRAEALRLFHEALAVDPAHRDSLYNLALVLETNALGERYGAGSSPGEAVATYRRLLAAHPDHAEGWTNLGVLLERLARPAEAAQAFESAIRAAPDLAEPHLFLADLLWERGERARAADLYRRYLEIGGAGEDAARALARSSR